MATGRFTIMKKARFEVQMIVGDEWGNVWNDDGKPLVFASFQDACVFRLI